MPIYPWDIAPKSSAYITTLAVKVFVIDLATDDEENAVVHEVDLDLGNKDHRAYLGKITAWAVQNKHSVETMNKNDANGE